MDLPAPVNDSLDGKIFVRTPSWSVWLTKLKNLLRLLTSYGNMHLHSFAGQLVVISIADTWYPITAGFMDGIVSGFIFQNASELVCQIPGYYTVVWSMALAPVSGNEEYEGTILVNGTASESMAGHAYIQAANKPQTTSGNGMIFLNDGDIIQLGVMNHGGTTNVLIQHASLTITGI